jgi:hypothetical protein
MPVPDFKTYCAILDRARSGHFALPAIKVDGELGSKKTYDPRAYLALAETAMTERVKQAASDLRASGKTMFAS